MVLALVTILTLAAGRLSRLSTWAFSCVLLTLSAFYVGKNLIQLIAEQTKWSIGVTNDKVVLHQPIITKALKVTKPKTDVIAGNLYF